MKYTRQVYRVLVIVIFSLLLFIRNRRQWSHRWPLYEGVRWLRNPVLR